MITVTTYEIQRKVIPGSIEHEFTDSEWVKVELKTNFYKGDDRNLTFMNGRINKLRGMNPATEYRMVEIVTIRKIMDL